MLHLILVKKIKSMESKSKLNLGCGNDIKEGFVNLDIAQLDGVDVVWDLNESPLPFENETFVYIECNDILEHIDLLKIMPELHRCLAKGGEIKIRVPHFTSRFNYIDPTHINRFSIQTFEFFLENSFFKREYYNSFTFESISYRKITFERSVFFPWNYLVKPLINLNLTTQRFYEATFMSRFFPASNIIVSLIK